MTKSALGDGAIPLSDQGHPLLVAASLEVWRWRNFDVNPGGVVVELREEHKL